MRQSFIGSLVALLVCGFAVTASAVPITFIHHGDTEAVGSIDGVGFDFTEFTITAFGDTDNIDLFGGGRSIDHGSASIEFRNGGALVGTFDFTTLTRTFVNNSLNLVGFSRATTSGPDLFNGPTDLAFGAWDMTTSIGPTSGNGNLLQWLLSPVATNGGQLILPDTGASVWFQAIVGERVPEPMTWTLVTFGLLGLGLRRRSRQA